jgi:nicotinamide-nucleotide adenylyltransferase
MRPLILSLATLSLGRRHAHVRAAMGSSSSQRFQRYLDLVDVASAPRVELTHGSVEPLGLSSLLVLDSSFNPPTRAHMHLLSAAARRLGTSRALLLLAKQNADKPIVGANLCQRLEMMAEVATASEPPDSVLCGVTAHPLFVDKTVALQSLCGTDARVVVLVGFDTWVRIIDPKYYAPGGLDSVLRQIFNTVEVVVASRESTSVNNLDAEMTIESQEALVRELPEEITQGRLHFLRNEPGMAELSSSALRKAIDSGDTEAVCKMLPDCLHDLVEREGLYKS